MVTATSLACRRGDDQSPGSHTEFVSHSTSRLVWEISSPSGSRAFSLGARALFSWSRTVPSTFISYRLLSEEWGLFRFLSLPSRLSRNQDFNSDILSPVRSWSRRVFARKHTRICNRKCTGHSSNTVDSESEYRPTENKCLYLITTINKELFYLEIEFRWML